jgi:alkylated DNA repair protein (DNA oxidative demethylase)
MTFELFAATDAVNSEPASVAPGAVLLRGFASADTARLWAAISAVTKSAPFRHMTTPGGYRMSVAMTNCGAAGWVSDKSAYRIPRSCE